MRAQLSPTPTGRRILLSTVSSDAHTWNLVFLQLLLEELGHEVVNLGPCVPDDLLVETAAAEPFDALVISTVNGHGCLDGARLARALRADPRTAHLPAMIGGKLSTRGPDDTSYVRELAEAGFDAVCVDGAPETLLHSFLGALPPAAPVRALPSGTS
ncbi:cobalamin B12-binding domain-containing protein [Streptomyces termitum]|uniref:Methylaspartate mutase n=1 Tax=Streptomyces termitum TaxID=67368 RepID=A0A918WCX9_9ACTN|nr:cobalamin-dependent protein [Streptomyces termitum]GHA98309.1 methylaspartate mutase [Streptomyces termitum]